MSIDDGGPAFPRHCSLREGQQWNDAHADSEGWGMSLRDWLAGMAMQGMSSQAESLYGDDPYDNIADSAYVQADAMLAQRKVEPDGDKPTT